VLFGDDMPFEPCSIEEHQEQCKIILKCLGDGDNLSTWSAKSFQTVMGMLYNIPMFTPLDTLFEKPVEAEFMSILRQLLVFNPGDRITAKQLLENPIFNQIRKPANERDADIMVHIVDTKKLTCIEIEQLICQE